MRNKKKCTSTFLIDRSGYSNIMFVLTYAISTLKYLLTYCIIKK